MPQLTLYLGPGGIQTVTAGKPSVQTSLVQALRGIGWQVGLAPDHDRATIWQRPGFHMVVNQPVEFPNTLTLRRCGWEPFWRIERTNDRWDWQIAGQTFDATRIAPDRGGPFQARWRRKLFGDLVPSPVPVPVPATGGGVFVPLQGKLLQQRHFQAASPLTMLQSVLARWPGRTVSATLHPGETYHDDEIAALQNLTRLHPNFTFATGGSDTLLAACDLVVTQNSTLALKGYLLDKPAMLWANIDFHHIAASVPRDGLDRAFAMAEGAIPPDFRRYLLWYFRQNALFAPDPGIGAAIVKRLAALGWPV